MIAQTTPPAIANLALRFQPTVRMSVFDRFWPVSVAAVLNEHDGSRHTCLVSPTKACAARAPALGDLLPGASPNSYLRYPEPLDRVEAQFKAFELGLGVSEVTISHWRENPATLDPYASGQIYFYDAGQVADTYKGIPRGLHLTSLQYWFFYPLNYFPTVVDSRGMLINPLGADHQNTDYHEGDWEHVTVLIDSRGAPRYLWMARHAKEGIAIPWDQVSLDHEHPVIYPALGGHPSYPSCGAHWRSLLFRAVADYVVCTPGLFTFSYASTPLVDLARMTWSCWPGFFGVAGHDLRSADHLSDPTGLILAAGPRSPLRQAENTHACPPPPR